MKGQLYMCAGIVQSRRGRLIAMSLAMLLPICFVNRMSGQSWSEAIDSSGDNSHYSPLKEFTKENVKDLKMAWSYPTGDQSAYTFAPLVAGNRIYVLAHNNSLVALDATTGKAIWIHTKLNGISNRGI